MVAIQTRITNKWLVAIEELGYAYVAGEIDADKFWSMYRFNVRGFRCCPEYRNLQRDVFARGKCQMPGCKRTKRLEMDHIRQVVVAPESALDPANVWLLCERCHMAKTKGQRHGFYTKLRARYDATHTRQGSHRTDPIAPPQLAQTRTTPTRAPRAQGVLA